MTPKALRRLGETALRRIFQHLDADASGSHLDPRSGGADERTGAHLPWEFGDERPLDAVRTVQNAVLRRAGSGMPRDGGARGIRLEVEDFEVAETTRRTGAAVALLVDLSFSMIQEGRWGPMKQTALALSHLIQSRFRQDALQIIGFDRTARQLNAMELAEVEPQWIQGTNLHHALMLAGRHVRRHPEAEPVVLIVTDGEPTAHLEEDGTAGVPVADHPGHGAGDGRRGRRAHPLRRRRSTSSSSATTRGSPGSSTRWPGATGAGSSHPTSAGSASTSWPTTCAPAPAAAAPPERRGPAPAPGPRTRVRHRDLNVTIGPVYGSVFSDVCHST